MVVYWMVYLWHILKRMDTKSMSMFGKPQIEEIVFFQLFNLIIGGIYKKISHILDITFLFNLKRTEKSDVNLMKIFHHKPEKKYCFLQ